MTEVVVTSNIDYVQAIVIGTKSKDLSFAVRC
jgi:hypothetical protein